MLRLRLISSTPGRPTTASWMPSWIIGPAGQPMEVRLCTILTFELAGFNSVKRAGIEVSLGFTANVKLSNVELDAKAVGKKAEVAAITEATMRGEIKDFKESLRRRVALLKGVPVEALQQVYDQRLKLNPGAAELVAACKAAGLKVLLVSGGFTFFANRVKDRLGIDFARSNLLDEADGQLTGQVVQQSWGDICDGAEKRRTLLEVAVEARAAEVAWKRTVEFFNKHLR